MLHNHYPAKIKTGNEVKVDLITGRSVQVILDLRKNLANKISTSHKLSSCQ